MFQINPQVNTANPMLVNLLKPGQSMTDDRLELNSLWIAHLLRQQSNLENQHASKHPLEASLEASFFAR